MSMSNYLENAVNDHIFGKATMTSPTIYVALSTTPFLKDGTGGTEPTTGGYIRLATASTQWSESVLTLDGRAQTVNLVELTFAEATAAWALGADIGYTALFDAISGGNLLYTGTVQTPRSILTGQSAAFAAGQIRARLN